MSDTTPQAPQSQFDAIRHSDESGEYWSARELAKLLQYSKWQNFEQAIKRQEQIEAEDRLGLWGQSEDE